MDTMFLLLTNSDSIYKQIVLWKKADRIEVLLDMMRGNSSYFIKSLIQNGFVILVEALISKSTGSHQIILNVYSNK